MLNIESLRMPTSIGIGSRAPYCMVVKYRISIQFLRYIDRANSRWPCILSSCSTWAQLLARSTTTNNYHPPAS